MNAAQRHPRVATAMLATLLMVGAGCAARVIAVGDAETLPAPTAVQGRDYFKVAGPAQRKYDAADGRISYCPLDNLGRPTCAYAELTAAQRDNAQRRGRQDIEVDPAGWPQHNGEVTIPALSDVTASKSYHGWMFNRSHLIADSLGGQPLARNLVTGTRTENVGSHQQRGQYDGGMAHAELMARDYLDSRRARACPLYYAATPQYVGDELIPRTVTVDIQSCDRSLDQRVAVSNTANGYVIDYSTGRYRHDRGREG